ncbi:hypothetical protein [Marinobacter sp. F3R08]|uniref:hypothetical protein n=1 Tax=Marinobacter sp. F3R08 TaxID=2841559 RepID=UPI001C0860B2|nr:hypothetical protein [Marinobacter sp. F3R08]MBU2952310.1 hypothetical protein [Marinobacter sp. F3R08]
MINVAGSLTIEVEEVEEDIKVEEEGGQKEEQVIQGSEFSLEEDGWRSLGDGYRQYEALFIYFGDDFEISFQVTCRGGHVTRSPYRIDGAVTIIEDNITVAYAGSGNDDDDWNAFH